MQAHVVQRLNLGLILIYVIGILDMLDPVKGFSQNQVNFLIMFVLFNRNIKIFSRRK